MYIASTTKQLLEKGRTLTLAELREITHSMELSESQARSMEATESEINKVSFQGKGSNENRCKCNTESNTFMKGKPTS